MAFKQRKHLYFIDGAVPNDEQAAHAYELPGIVCFRNVKMIDPDDDAGIEDFDELHGEIPASYARAAAAKRGEAPAEAPKGEAPAAGSTLAPAGATGGKVKPPEGGGQAAWKPNA